MPKMNSLRDMLGRWEYTHGTSNKFWQVIPDPSGADKYQITWGRIGDKPLGSQIVDNFEAFRRVREKDRGGYTLKTPYDVRFAGMVEPVKSSADITVTDLQNTKKSNNSKPPKVKNPAVASDKKGFNFTDWLENKT